ncbi:MAG TPA: fatty acid--CoA ligase family protein [Patescibacteria group bacterium]|nr:fatty acid--CoA ligase family protein [Gammaproteobacteria bacterium]HWA51473.1 fatty acid--CoA ligase family protein [Patescibacteria group bacterium]
MSITFLLEQFENNSNQEAMIWNGESYNYAHLHKTTLTYLTWLKNSPIKKGSVVELCSDFSPATIALLLALIQHQCILILTTSSSKEEQKHPLQLTEVEFCIQLDEHDNFFLIDKVTKTKHPLITQLRELQVPGLILFSSGSTGNPKGVVHNFAKLLEKFKKPRIAKKTICFLLFDHIGGLNTLLQTLSNGGCVITVKNRTPQHICYCIEQYKAQALPTTPTFINLFLLSAAHTQYDLSSLEIVTYSAEPMSESVLTRFNQLFPQIRLSQNYGLSEVGILNTKSKSSNSLYMKIEGENYQTRIINGMLEIKAESAMLGYLNAESPFTEDGWFKTEDKVTVEGDYLRILGRVSEIINVGGKKVYPSEIENVIRMMNGVLDVVVVSEPNQILGQIVKARIVLDDSINNIKYFHREIKEFCKNKLAPYKIPQKIEISKKFFHNERFKNVRKVTN